MKLKEPTSSLLLEFCKMFEDLYGKQHYTINYTPSHSSYRLYLGPWSNLCVLVIPFERLNGILGDAYIL